MIQRLGNGMFRKLVTASLALLAITTSVSVHADFRKALDAYIARDGTAMLKEVKDAVDKKNDDGLILFLHAMSIDANTSAKRNLYEDFKDKRQLKTSLDSILNEQQKQELFDSLTIAANYSSIDTQYLFAYVSRIITRPKQQNGFKTNEEYAKKGSYVAHNSSDLVSKAEAGDPFSQLRLGLKYLNFVDYAGYGCEQASKETICQTKNEVEGYALLKQALKTYEKRGHGDLGIYADSICDLFQNTAKDDKTQLRQAYLWCVVGINSGAHYSWSLLKKMHESGNLKIAAPEINKIWGMSIQQDRDRLYKTLNLTEIKELPDWIIETRKGLVKEKLPIFTYYADDYMEYELDVYADGTVKIGFGSTNNGFPGHELGNISFVDAEKYLLMKTSPKKVKAFLAEIKKTGFYDWTLNNQIGIPFCDNFDASHCLPKRYQITIWDKTKKHRIYLGGLVWDIGKIGVGREKETTVTERIAKVSVLVEKYFPTQRLRCGLGNSEEYKQACLQRDSRWTTLAKERK